MAKLHVTDKLDFLQNVTVTSLAWKMDQVTAHQLYTAFGVYEGVDYFVNVDGEWAKFDIQLPYYPESYPGFAAINTVA